MFRSASRNRTFLGGKLFFNDGRSVIDCIIRNMSEDGAFLEVESVVGIPDQFELVIAGEDAPISCRLVWQTEKRIGFTFGAEAPPSLSKAEPPTELVRSQLLALRSALDEVNFGVVLLDAELRAQFINRSFRKMWQLSDAKAESKPAFVALMYHGRETRAYEVPRSELDSYVAERVAAVKAGNSQPRDLRLTNGSVIRLQCAVLPNGGRMLSYVPVTDIVRHSDELEVLRDALDQVKDGVILLDADLNANFVNRAVRRLWDLTDEQIATHPSFIDLVTASRKTGAYGKSPEDLEAFIAGRIALIRAGDPAPRDIKTSDGRHVRAQCTVLPNGGRMITYCDITDLVRSAEQLHELATLDAMTGLYNRRHFLDRAQLEWDRFNRYYRPTSMLMVDIDHFKSVNDRFGHAAGDAALIAVANACKEGLRSSDLAGRIGGEEFALLLPETDLEQAGLVAERICKHVATQKQTAGDTTFNLTVSIGVATATLGMAGISTLMKSADQALYQAKFSGRNRIVYFSPAAEGTSKLAAE